MSMLDPKQIQHAVVSVAVAAASCLAATSAVAAEESTRATLHVYQQRTADGRVVLTDRPVAGALTQRTWQVEPEDATVRQRRQEARLEALEANERIQRRFEAQRQRDDELLLARLRLAEVEARLMAERAHAEAAAQAAAVTYVPTFAQRPFPRPPRFPRPGPPRPRLPMQPGLALMGAPSG